MSNTKKIILAGVCLCAMVEKVSDTASGYGPSNFPRQWYIISVADSLQSAERWDDFCLSIDSTLRSAWLSLESRASVWSWLSYLWEHGFSFDNSTDTSQDVDDNGVSAPVEIVTSPSEVWVHSWPRNIDKDPLSPGVFVVWQEHDSLDYLFYRAQEYPRLDIHLTDHMISSINKYGSKKIGMRLAPTNNIVHVYNKYDFELMTLLLSLWGDEARNLIDIPDYSQKIQTFNAEARLQCVSQLRVMSCDYLDLYNKTRDKDFLFASHQDKMPGVFALFLESYVYYHPDMAAKPPHVVRYAICQTIRHKTKNLWLAKMGKKIGF